MATLEEISRLLYGAGEEVTGWNSTQEDLIAVAAKTFPGKAFCVVKEWILIDLTVTPDEKEKLTRLGLLSMALLAHEIVLDSAGRFQPSMWVRSNFGVSFTEGCMFETKNTVYLLLGSGLRKDASLSAAFSMKAG
ncbi:hypothetical protein HX788_21750 [Pseudomonas edaphica]|uniref:DUF6957 domain-containing protein n=1 Tax=Pseudomonas edaphica TaxID=2006980 RepID=A0A7Y8FKF0_9PSED|nr:MULTISPECIES: hypothetical protein [Pseudomonas]MBI6947593.1 hypothetical protein [Pseudomonas koreensis]NWC47145.1 hypothetical protein [Pseudomonas sp. IPO3747]NWE09735.1 hypothetical protein [Pseudomonas edaphica]NWE80809.1 hypothetical protein [Pseudomonas edaphica]